MRQLRIYRCTSNAVSSSSATRGIHNAGCHRAVRWGEVLNLETFRKTGVGVRTPVWFAQDVLHGVPTITVFYIYSETDTGKVKRIRNNPKVRVAPCTMRGDVRGAWIDGRARICEDDEVAHGQQLLTQKYGLLKLFGDFFSRLMRHKQTVIAVEVD